MTMRSACGLERVTPYLTVPRLRMAWEAKKVRKVVTSEITRVTKPKMTALTARTMPRWGTAVKVVRIIPEEYSVVMISTPRTPMASWLRNSPLNGNPAALKFAVMASRPPRAEVRPRANSEPRPTVRTAVTAKVQKVERRERILVHSERATPTMPGRWSGLVVETKTGDVAVLTGRQPSWLLPLVRPALGCAGSGPGRGTPHRRR